MKISPRHILIAATGAIWLGAAAQTTGLDHEINQERSVEPVEREISRLALTPGLRLQKVTPPTLSFSNLRVASRVPSTVSFLEPAQWRDTLPQGDTRGYAVLGLGAPLFSIPATAGYRLFDDDTKILGGWIQYDGEAYKRCGSYWRSQAIAADIYGSYWFSADSRLDVDIYYRWNRFNQPRYDVKTWENTSRLDVSALWSSRYDGLLYLIGARFGHFGYTVDPSQPAGVNENTFGLKADGRLDLSENSAAHLCIGWDVQRRSESWDMDNLWERVKGKTTSVLTLTPAYSLRGDRWLIKVGPRIDFTFNGGKFFHIAPEVQASWEPTPLFALGARISGGEHINTLAALNDAAQRTSPYAAYGISHIPLAVDLQATIGPKKGFWVTADLGWARANEWLMPDLGFFRKHDIKGFHGGIAFGGAYKSLIKGSVSWHTAPGSYDKGYYMWRDRARHVMEVEMEVYPIEKLTVTAKYDLRACRSLYSVSYLPLIPDMTDVRVIGRTNLGNISRLTLGGLYKYTPRLSFFADVMVNFASYCDIDLTPAAPWNFHIGASIKF